MPQERRLRAIILVVLASACGIVLLPARLSYRAAAGTPLPPDTEVGQITEGAGRANFDWFKQPAVKFGIAFTAPRTGDTVRLAIPWRYTVKENNPKKSYGWGNYGTYTCELYANGDTNIPAGTALATIADISPMRLMVDSRGRPQDDYLLPIMLKAHLKAGEIYHLVISNTDPDPGTNWSSINTMMTRLRSWERWTSSLGDARAEVLVDGRWSPWSSRHNPWNLEGRNDLNGSQVALIITWTDQTTTGNPYWSAAVDDPIAWWGPYRAGELIRWTRPNTAIARIGLSVRKIGLPSGPLRYHLEEVNGRAITGKLTDPEDMGSGPAQSWVTAELLLPFTLMHGRSYRLWFESPQSTDARNCYLQAPVYTPGDPERKWADLSWGGRSSHLIVFTGGQWMGIDTHDLCFSLRTAAP